jgi:hypothetical protein
LESTPTTPTANGAPPGEATPLARLALNVSRRHWRLTKAKSSKESYKFRLVAAQFFHELCGDLAPWCYYQVISLRADSNTHIDESANDFVDLLHRTSTSSLSYVLDIADV